MHLFYSTVCSADLDILCSGCFRPPVYTHDFNPGGLCMVSDHSLSDLCPYWCWWARWDQTWTALIWLLGTIITTSFRFQLSRTQIPRALWSVGDHPLTKEPEDSKYEIAFPAPLSLVILEWWKRDPIKGNVIISVRLNYIIPVELSKVLSGISLQKAIKFL